MRFSYLLNFNKNINFRFFPHKNNELKNLKIKTNEIKLFSSVNNITYLGNTSQSSKVEANYKVCTRDENLVFY